MCGICIKFDNTFNLLIIKLDFTAEIYQIHGHMGLKMWYETRAHKDKIYSRLGILYLLPVLRFEGVMPTRACGFPDLNYQCFKGYRTLPFGSSSRSVAKVRLPADPASSTKKSAEWRIFCKFEILSPPEGGSAYWLILNPKQILNQKNQTTYKS